MGRKKPANLIKRGLIAFYVRLREWENLWGREREEECSKEAILLNKQVVLTWPNNYTAQGDIFTRKELQKFKK